MKKLDVEIIREVVKIRHHDQWRFGVIIRENERWSVIRLGSGEIVRVETGEYETMTVERIDHAD